MDDLVAAARGRVLAAVRGVKHAHRIVVLDGAGARIVGAVAGVSEILDAGAFLVEDVRKGRQPYPQMAAVYLVAPARETAEAIVRDWTPPARPLASGRTGPLYAEAHVFWTAPVPREVVSLLGASPFARYARAFAELRLDFVVRDERVFTAGVSRLPPEEEGDAHGDDAPISDEDASRRLFDALCLIASMADGSSGGGSSTRATVRYQRGAEKAASIAARVQALLDGQKADPAVPPFAGTLILVERSVDPVAPVLHEFSVHALAADVVGLGADADVFQGASLRDGTWRALRFAHVADASRTLTARFESLCATEKAIASSDGGLDGLKARMAALGGFGDEKAEVARNVALLEACFSAVSLRGLASLADLEQSLVLGSLPTGESLTAEAAWRLVLEKFRDARLRSFERARLALLLLAGACGAAAENGRSVESLLEAARLDAGDLCSVRAFIARFGVGKGGQRMPCRSSKSARASVVDREPAYDSSRYVPGLAVLFEDAVHGTLPLADFPLVRPSGEGSSAASAGAAGAPAPVSLRQRRSGPAAAVSAAAAAGGPVVVFVVGGATLSEARETHAAAAALRRPLFLGADTLLTPASFFRGLRRSGASSRL